MPFSSTETMSLSFQSVGFNSYRCRFEPLPSAGMPSLLLSRGLERLQWKTTEITMVAINTIAPHVTPIINGRFDDLLEPSSLFPPVQDNNNKVECKIHPTRLICDSRYSDRLIIFFRNTFHGSSNITASGSNRS